MAVFKPAFPAISPNPQNVLEGMIATNCSIGAAAPTFLEVRRLFLDWYLLSRMSMGRLGHVILLP